VKARVTRSRNQLSPTAAQSASDKTYTLRLFVTGLTPRSLRAIQNVKQICEDHLKEGYELTVVDIYQQPHLAKEHQVLAIPTLIKLLPRPLRRFIGDMNNTERILLGLDVAPSSTPP
jgi:circadian clock protein KaiB